MPVAAADGVSPDAVSDPGDCVHRFVPRTSHTGSLSNPGWLEWFHDLNHPAACCTFARPVGQRGRRATRRRTGRVSSCMKSCAMRSVLAPLPGTSRSSLRRASVSVPGPVALRCRRPAAGATSSGTRIPSAASPRSSNVPLSTSRQWMVSWRAAPVRRASEAASSAGYPREKKASMTFIERARTAAQVGIVEMASSAGLAAPACGREGTSGSGRYTGVGAKPASRPWRKTTAAQGA